MSRLSRPGCLVALGALTAAGPRRGRGAAAEGAAARRARCGIRGWCAAASTSTRCAPTGPARSTTWRARRSDAGLALRRRSATTATATRAPDPPAYRSGVLCLDAVEISTTGGHYVALGLATIAVPPRRRAARRRRGRRPARRVRDRRTSRVAEGRAPLDGRGTTGLDGLEWLNADSEWRDERPPSLARALATYWLRAPETIASAVRPRGQRLRRVGPPDARVAASSPWPGTTRTRASASRGNWEPEQDDVVLRLPGYASAFRAFGVRARLAGRSPVMPRAGCRAVSSARSGPGTCSPWSMRSPDPEPSVHGAPGSRASAQMGDTLAQSGPVRLEARVTPAPGLGLALVRNGRTVIARADGRLRFDHPASLERAVYRVEATLAGRGRAPACRGW